MVTDDNRETNLVAMVAVKANSVKPPYDRHTLPIPILRTLVIKTSEFAAVLLAIITDAFPPPPVIFCADAFIEIWPRLERVAKDAKNKKAEITTPAMTVLCFFNIKSSFSTRNY